MPGERILKAATGNTPYPFLANVDGYFLRKRPVDAFAAGEQARVPLLVGWNSAEGDYPSITRYYSVLGDKQPTPENYGAALKRLFGDRVDEALSLYEASTPDEIRQAATDLASDRFIGYGVWKWSDLHGRTGGKPVYRYFYTHPRPSVRSTGAANGEAKGPPPAEAGAVHSAEIEYALGNLATNKVFAWTREDYRLSETMQGYFANFVKSGDPNGPGLPAWPAVNQGREVRVMRLNVQSRAEPDQHRDRYLFLDRIYGGRR
jgi:para-nitrobenzyl esterase